MIVNGKPVLVDMRIHMAIQRAIEVIAKDPDLATADSTQVAAELKQGIEEFLDLPNIERKLKLYFEIHRGDQRGN